MKWFRHMSDASDDEFIASLEAEFGDSGYAWWWKTLEKISRNMDGTNRHHAEYPIDHWMAFLRIKRRKNLEKFLEFCEKNQKFSYEFSGNILKIGCLKLLELKDEYSKKSGQTPDRCPDKLPSQKKNTEEDTEQEKKERLLTESSGSQASPSDTTTPSERVEYQKIVEVWNQTCGDVLPQVKEITAQRRTAMKARRTSLKTLDDWRWYFSAIRGSPFLTGENDRGWRCDFDWVLKPANMAKIREGKYGAQPSGGYKARDGTTGWRDYDHWADTMLERQKKNGNTS